MAEQHSIPPAEQFGGRFDHMATSVRIMGLNALLAVRSAGGAIVQSMGTAAQVRAEEWYAENSSPLPPRPDVTDGGEAAYDALKEAERILQSETARVALKAYGGGATAFIEERPQGTTLDPIRRRELIKGWNALHPEYAITN